MNSWSSIRKRKRKRESSRLIFKKHQANKMPKQVKKIEVCSENFQINIRIAWKAKVLTFYIFTVCLLATSGEHRKVHILVFFFFPCEFISNEHSTSMIFFFVYFFRWWASVMRMIMANVLRRMPTKEKRQVIFHWGFFLQSSFWKKKSFSQLFFPFFFVNS